MGRNDLRRKIENLLVADDRTKGKMNRNELASELNVRPWDVDDWLLWGCPAKKFRVEWEFDPEKVRVWLKAEKIRIAGIRPQHPPKRPKADRRWFKDRCPVCIDRGFPGEKAGRVYTLGEISEGEWHLRRTGIPCGHSAYLNPKVISYFRKSKSSPAGRDRLNLER